MKRDSLIPEAQLAEIVAALYNDAQAKKWNHLPPRERSRAYTDWVDDPRIGKVLAKYMSPEAARAWIKDGPMKEYSRALRGTGRYARFGNSGGTTSEELIRGALGDSWHIEEGSTGIKPFHARARNADGEVVYLAWDESRNFKNLVWASLRASVDFNIPCHIIVTELPGCATARDVVGSQTAIAKLCGLELHYVREQLGSTT